VYLLNGGGLGLPLLQQSLGLVLALQAKRGGGQVVMPALTYAGLNQVQQELQMSSQGDNTYPGLLALGQLLPLLSNQLGDLSDRGRRVLLLQGQANKVHLGQNKERSFC
jgi:hypothetical protein